TGHARANSPRRISLRAHAARGLFVVEAAYAVLRGERTVQNFGRAKQLAGNQPGLDGRNVRNSAESGSVCRERSGKRKTPRRDLCRRAFLQRREHDLGGHRRRVNSHHAGWRKILAKCDSAPTQALEQSFHHRSFRSEERRVGKECRYRSGKRNRKETKM